MRYRIMDTAALSLAAVLATLPAPAAAGVTLYEKDGTYVAIGGSLQAQYRRDDPDGGRGTDDFFLRRLEVYVEGSVTENVSGMWEVDFGGRGEEPEVGDAYITYSGLSVGDIVVGNQSVPFSREKLTSDKRQQTVERQFAGSSSFGVPDKQMGVSLTSGTGTLAWQAGVYKAGFESDPARLSFASRVNEDAEYFGDMLAGRLDFNPLGHFRMAQGAFGEALKLGIGVNAFAWRNDDDDVVDPASDYDKVTGLGIDGALRTGYLSADAAYQSYASETLDGGFTGGLVEDGEGDFDTYMVKGGYMLVPNRFEGVLAYSVLDADAWDEDDTRISAGTNFFLNRHNAKIQVTYEFGRDVEGIAGNDANTLYVQFQQLL